MKVTFVLPEANQSGGVRVVVTLADYLGRRGHRALVVFPSRTPTWKTRVRALSRGGWARAAASDLTYFRVPGVAVPYQETPYQRPVRADEIPDADVIVATHWRTAEWVAQMPPTKGVKIYFIQGDETVLGDPPDRVEATWRLPLRKIAVARWLVGLVRDRDGNSVAMLVPNAVNTTLFHAPPRSKQPTPTVGLMYATARFKGTDIGLEAFRRAATAIPGLRLRSFGEPAKAGFPLPAGTVHMRHPSQDQLRDVYAGCDAWLFASRSEGFGLPILEAMACRTPVIGTPAGAAPELLSGGGGIMVRPDDPADMAAAIVRVCQMPEVDWQAMSEAAYATATRYTWDDATDRFEAALVAAARDEGRL